MYNESNEDNFDNGTGLLNVLEYCLDFIFLDDNNDNNNNIQEHIVNEQLEKKRDFFSNLIDDYYNLLRIYNTGINKIPASINENKYDLLDDTKIYNFGDIFLEEEINVKKYNNQQQYQKILKLKSKQKAEIKNQKKKYLDKILKELKKKLKINDSCEVIYDKLKNFNMYKLGNIIEKDDVEKREKREKILEIMYKQEEKGEKFKFKIILDVYHEIQKQEKNKFLTLTNDEINDIYQKIENKGLDSSENIKNKEKEDKQIEEFGNEVLQILRKKKGKQTQLTNKKEKYQNGNGAKTIIESILEYLYY